MRYSRPNTNPAAPRSARRGVAGLPMVLVALFLAALLVAMFEVRRAVRATQALDNAARKGCDYGIKPHHKYSDIVSHANQVLASNNLSGLSPTITVQVARYQGLDTADNPRWGSFTTVTSDSAYRPNQSDLVSVQVSLPAGRACWLTRFYVKDLLLTSSPVVMMREG